MGKFESPASSVFVGIGHVQHADAVWSVEHTLRDHTIVVLEGYFLKNAVRSSHGTSLGCNSNLSGTDEAETSFDVNDVSKQDKIETGTLVPLYQKFLSCADLFPKIVFDLNINRNIVIVCQVNIDRAGDSILITRYTTQFLFCSDTSLSKHEYFCR